MQKPNVQIEYCPRCGWLLRAGWLAQELLTTFSTQLSGITLVPAEDSGRFRVSVGDQQIWCRVADGGFPQAAELKRRLRDVAFPDLALGHSEKVSLGDEASDASVQKRS